MRLFGHVTHAALEADPVLAHIAAIEENLAVGRLDESSEHFHGGALTGAVRSDVTENLAGANREADAIHGGDTVIALDQTSHFEHVDGLDSARRRMVFRVRPHQNFRPGFLRTRAYFREIRPFEYVLFSIKAKSRCGKPAGKSGMPSPRSTGTTPRWSSSTRSAVRKSRASSPPPINQMFLPGRFLSLLMSAAGDSLVNTIPSRSPGGFEREKTYVGMDDPKEPPIFSATSSVFRPMMAVSIVLKNG